jgi:hypothetical protein
LACTVSKTSVRKALTHTLVENTVARPGEMLTLLNLSPQFPDKCRDFRFHPKCLPKSSNPQLESSRAVDRVARSVTLARSYPRSRFPPARYRTCVSCYDAGRTLRWVAEQAAKRFWRSLASRNGSDLEMHNSYGRHRLAKAVPSGLRSNIRRSRWTFSSEAATGTFQDRESVGGRPTHASRHSQDVRRS